MTYLRITDRCNMKCRHCCFSCGPAGEDMTESTFEQCISFAEETAARTGCPTTVVLGGGEPTVHKHFREFLEAIEDRAYNRRQIGEVKVITNGKRVSDALFLLEMAKRSSVLYAGLTLDNYHEPIDSAVIVAWMRARAQYSNIEVARTDTIISNTGRARANGLQALDYCCCSGPLIEPNGDIFGCGCKTEHLGTVFNPSIPYAYFEELKQNQGAICSRGRSIPRQGDRGNEDREELDMARFRTALAALPSRRARYV